MDPIILLWLHDQKKQTNLEHPKSPQQLKTDFGTASTLSSRVPVLQIINSDQKEDRSSCSGRFSEGSISEQSNAGRRPGTYTCNTESGGCLNNDTKNDNMIKMNPQSIPQYFDENSIHKLSSQHHHHNHSQQQQQQLPQYLQTIHQNSNQLVSSVAPLSIDTGGKKLLGGENTRKRAAEVPVSWIASSVAVQQQLISNPATAVNRCNNNKDLSTQQVTSLSGNSAQQHLQLHQQQQQQQQQQHSGSSTGHTGVSPVPSLTCSDIGEMDLDFWDVDTTKTADSDVVSQPSSMLVNNNNGGCGQQTYNSQLNGNATNNSHLVQQQQQQQQLYGNNKDCSLPSSGLTSLSQASNESNGVFGNVVTSSYGNRSGTPSGLVSSNIASSVFGNRNVAPKNYYQGVSSGGPLNLGIQGVSLDGVGKSVPGCAGTESLGRSPSGLITSALDANNNNSSSNSGSETIQSDAGDLKGTLFSKKPGGPTGPSSAGGPQSRQQEELCLVCADRASGYHYNALTCEGCKGFFRRSITRKARYQCKYGGQCEMDMYMRRKCQHCRFRKCISVGMRPDCVVPESQNVMKRQNKKKPDPETLKPNASTPEAVEVHDEKPNLAALNRAIREVCPLTSDQECLINRLVYYQLEFESPSPEDVTRVTGFPLGCSEKDSQKRFEHITEITILTVQLIVEFSKRVPGFDTLQREDQITLLKACSSEVMMLRGARKYDVATDSIVFANNQPYTLDNYRSASVGENADALFQFCRNMCNLRVDNAEYALLTAIVIFSERPALLEPDKVEQVQMFYVETLRRYSENHRNPPGSPAHFAKLLAILTELRTLGNMNSEMCFNIKFKQNKELPPFLAEIWDIQEAS
ncbi:ecdysone receptor-like [Varroa jacobsoni]|uniref:ecdysone receptor-like n=1 Tax=Varroa jacobsoni TaxID=62625 RepID=UPI000BF848B4|nr:ecdysone receptor-like [Varroa jacobsoni]